MRWAESPVPPRQLGLLTLALVSTLGVALLVAWPAGRPDSPARAFADPVGAAPVLRVTAASHPVIDSRGDRWAAASGFSGGHIVRDRAHIDGTASPALYTTVRTGVRSFTAQVATPGVYAVELYLDEALDGGHRRVFDVQVNGRPFATGVDVRAAVGPHHAYHVLDTTVVSGTRLEVRFVPRAGEPMVSAVELAHLGPDQGSGTKWSDEFTGPAGTRVDPHKWKAETGGGGWGNHELETYTADVANAHLDGHGHLAIVARRAPPTRDRPASYTSARLDTEGLASFRYGRLVARARLPIGQGLWPGFWALGTDLEQAGFPASGEIDVMESNGHPGVLSGKVHGPQGANQTWSLGLGVDTATSGRFVDFGVLWTPIGVAFLVDGRTYATATPADLPTDGRWVLDKRFFLILDLAVGGRFPGMPDGSTPFPAALLVDYVRVYRR